MKAIRHFLLVFLLGVPAQGCRSVGPPAPSATADPVSARALALRQSCAARGEGQAVQCFDRALREILEAEGVAPTMTLLERLGTLDEDVRRDGHLYAHSIGLAAYRSADQVGATFAQCTPIFQSGCYHGVIQAYFAGLAGSGGEAALTPEAINALCADYRSDPGSRWLLFQCAHGMGHGLTMFFGHHLPRALKGCDLLRDDWERNACHGGAFMENVVQATAPHHAVGRPQAQGGAEGHAEHGHHHAGHGASAPAEPFQAVNPDDLHYPCSAVEERYRYTCYGMQTSVVLHFRRGEVGAAAELCATAAEAYRLACYQSLGRDISPLAQQNHPRALQLCSRVTPPYRQWCYVGYAKNLVDLTADVSDGMAFCRLVTDPGEKQSCYTAIGEQIWVLSDDRQKRQAWCEAAEPDYRRACAHAAGLQRAEPGTSS